MIQQIYDAFNLDAYHVFQLFVILTIRFRFVESRIFLAARIFVVVFYTKLNCEQYNDVHKFFTQKLKKLFNGKSYLFHSTCFVLYTYVDSFVSAALVLFITCAIYEMKVEKLGRKHIISRVKNKKNKNQLQ